MANGCRWQFNAIALPCLEVAVVVASGAVLHDAFALCHTQYYLANTRIITCLQSGSLSTECDQASTELQHCASSDISEPVGRKAVERALGQGSSAFNH